MLVKIMISVLRGDSIIFIRVKSGRVLLVEGDMY